MDTIKNLKIQMKPYITENYQFQYADVVMELEEPQLPTGAMTASLWKTVAGVPGAELGSGGLQAADEAGRLELTETLEKDPSGFDKRVWRIGRESQGDVTLRYRFFPRDLTDVDRCHPIFDVIQEHNGALICGVTSLMTVPEDNYHIYFSWDKSNMPSDADAAAIKGQGDFDYVGTPQDYSFSLYIAGRFHCQQDKSGKYRVYWLDDQLPDREKVVDQVPRLLKVLCRFFRDEEIDYSVFFRKEPFEISNSGTAFDGGFAFGYSDTMPLIMEQALSTIAHEIVHNWPHMDGEPGEKEWFDEGTAEFYSMVIPYREGIVDLDHVARQLTEKSLNYYNNKYREMPNREAYGLFWKERDAQRLPYGRGLFYLIDTDRKIKAASGGKRSIDDLVLASIERRKSGAAFAKEDWERMIESELGREAVTEFRQVMDGKIIQPSKEWLGGAFDFSKGEYGTIKTGFFDDALIWSAKEGNQNL